MGLSSVELVVGFARGFVNWSAGKPVFNSKQTVWELKTYAPKLQEFDYDILSVPTPEPTKIGNIITQIIKSVALKTNFNL